MFGVLVYQSVISTLDGPRAVDLHGSDSVREGDHQINRPIGRKA